MPLMFSLCVQVLFLHRELFICETPTAFPTIMAHRMDCFCFEINMALAFIVAQYIAFLR